MSLIANWAGQLEIFTIDALHEHLREFKRQRGLHSFDDMIARVEESLDTAKNRDAENLLQTLRDRYHCGIVDEFQDTDPLQWTHLSPHLSRKAASRSCSSSAIPSRRSSTSAAPTCRPTCTPPKK